MKFCCPPAAEFFYFLHLKDYWLNFLRSERKIGKHRLNNQKFNFNFLEMLCFAVVLLENCQSLFIAVWEYFIEEVKTTFEDHRIFTLRGVGWMKPRITVLQYARLSHGCPKHSFPSTSNYLYKHSSNPFIGAVIGKILDSNVSLLTSNDILSVLASWIVYINWQSWQRLPKN